MLSEKIENRYVQYDSYVKKEQMHIKSAFTQIFREYMHTDVQKKAWKERQQTDKRIDFQRWERDQN